MQGLRRTMSELSSKLTQALEDTIRAIRSAKDLTLNKLVPQSHAAVESIEGQSREEMLGGRTGGAADCVAFVRRGSNREVQLNDLISES